MIREAGGDGYHELLPGVRLKTLVYGERTILTEVRFVGGAVVPVHAHPQEQTGYVVAGKLRFTVDGEERVVRPGDSWNLPSAVPHGAVALEDSVVVEVFSPPREDYLALLGPA